MRIYLVLTLTVIGCCHRHRLQSPGPPSEMGARSIPEGGQGAREFETPSEPLPSLAALHLAFRQVPSPSDVTIELTLTNTGASPIKLTTNPRFDHRSFEGTREAEFAIQLIDARGRWISYACTRCVSGLFQANIGVLTPGQTRVFALTLDRSCYDLVPGERLSFIATYANLFAEILFREATKSLPEVQPPGWLELVVPPGWSRRS